MKTDNVTITILKADEGKVLTNGETYSSPGGTVYLAKDDSADNWREINENEVPTEKVETHQENMDVLNVK